MTPTRTPKRLRGKRRDLAIAGPYRVVSCANGVMKLYPTWGPWKPRFCKEPRPNLNVKVPGDDPYYCNGELCQCTHTGGVLERMRIAECVETVLNDVCREAAALSTKRARGGRR